MVVNNTYLIIAFISPKLIINLGGCIKIFSKIQEKFSLKKGFFLFLFLLLSISLLPKATVNSAPTYEFTSISYDKIKASNNYTYTYQPVSGHRANALNKNGKAVWDRNQGFEDHAYASQEWERAKARGENPGTLPEEFFYAIFKRDGWDRDNKSEYVRIPINEYLNAKEKGTTATSTKEGAVALHHLEKQCFLFVCGYAPTRNYVIGTINAYKKADTYNLAWSYTKPPKNLDAPAIDEFFKKNPPKITGACCGEMKLTTAPATFTGANHTLVADLNDPLSSIPGGSASLGEFYQTSAHMPSRGNLTLPNGTVVKDVPVSDAATPTPTKANVNILLYAIEKKTEALIGNAKDFLGSETFTKIEPQSGSGFEANGLVNNSASAATFENVPDGKYKATVRLAVTTGFAGWAERIKAGAVGGDIKTMEGTVNVEVKGGETIPKDPFITLQPSTVRVDGIIEDVFKNAIEDAIDYVIDLCLKALEIFMGWVNGILNRGNFMGDDPSLQNIWKSIRNVTLSVFTLGILLISFANVLQIDIEKYNVTRMLPKLVIATVMSYFSFLIANFLLTITAAIQLKLIAETGTATIATDLNAVGTSAYETIKAPGEIVVYGIALILVMIVALVAAIILCILLIARIAVLWLLIAISPLAFMMQVMPFTEHLYMDWWNKFFKWAFMGPAVLFMLFLASEVIDASSSGIASPESSPIFQLLMAGILIFMATIIPFTMGGEVFKGIGVDQQSLWRQAPGFKEGQSFIKQRTKPGADRADRRATAWRSSLANRKSRLGGAVGRFAAGVNKEEAVGLSGQPKADRKKIFEGADKTALNEYIAKTEGKGAWGEAAFDHAVEKGKLDMKDERVADVVEVKLEENMGANFDKIVKAITKEAPDAFADAVNNGRGGPQVAQAAEESIRRRKDEDLKSADLKFMQNQFAAGTASPKITFRVNEIAGSTDKLDKVLGMSHDIQAEWGHVLHEAGHHGATGNADLDRKVTQILAAR